MVLIMYCDSRLLDFCRFFVISHPLWIWHDLAIFNHTAAHNLMQFPGSATRWPFVGSLLELCAVSWSCGAFAHGRWLTIRSGIGDWLIWLGLPPKVCFWANKREVTTKKWHLKRKAWKSPTKIGIQSACNTEKDGCAINWWTAWTPPCFSWRVVNIPNLPNFELLSVPKQDWWPSTTGSHQKIRSLTRGSA